MMYHAESFANNGFETYIVGYPGMRYNASFRLSDLDKINAGSEPTPALLSTPHVQFFYLAQLPSLFSHIPFIIVAPIKIMHQVLAIFITILFTIPHTSEFIVAQVSIVYSSRSSLFDCAEEPTKHSDSCGPVVYYLCEAN